jgi:putative solute:sodium symporter small subunit
MADERQADSSSAAYWRANKALIAVLLAIWALVSFGFAILLARPLYGVHVGSLPMSFWWAQQGSMVVFVLLIFIYAWRMDRLDEKYDVHEESTLRQVKKARRAAAAGGEGGR